MADISDLERRLDETRAEIVLALRELVESADDTLWLTDSETVFERLAYLYEVSGGDRISLVREFPDYFDIDVA